VTIAAIIDSVLSRKVLVTENNVTRRVNLLEAGLLRLTQDAVKHGKPKALEYLFELMEGHIERQHQAEMRRQREEQLRRPTVTLEEATSAYLRMIKGED